MKKKRYFIAVKRENNEVFLSTTKTGIAHSLGVQYITIHRQLKQSNPYSNSKYTVWKDVPMMKMKVVNNSKYLKWI